MRTIDFGRIRFGVLVVEAWSLTGSRPFEYSGEVSSYDPWKEERAGREVKAPDMESYAEKVTKDFTVELQNSYAYQKDIKNLRKMYAKKRYNEPNALVKRRSMDAFCDKEEPLAGQSE